MKFTPKRASVRPQFQEEPLADLKIAQLPRPMPIHAPPKSALADPDACVHQPDVCQAHTEQQARGALRILRARGLQPETKFF